MGVKGLRTFIDNNASKFLMPNMLYESKLVIDGTDLTAELYFRSSNRTQDYLWGGDFATFADECRRFFSQLKRCKVTPIVVFDCLLSGPDNLQQQISKTKANFKAIKNFSTKTSSQEKFMPSLTNLTMFTILKELDIEFLQSTGETNKQIALIANQFGCPVLSNNNDFCIFDLTGGLILFDLLDRSYQNPSHPSKRIVSLSGDYIEFVDSRLYHVDEFVARFPGLNKELLPLLSFLIGKDEDNQPSIINNINDVIVYQPWTLDLRVKNKTIKKIVALLNWMRNKTLEEVIDLLSSKTVANLQQLRSAFEPYLIDQESYLSKYLSTASPSNVSTEDSRLPAWFVREFHTGKLDAWMMDVVVNKRNLLVQDVQNFSWPSPHHFTNYLRYIMYALLRVTDDRVNVEEYDRIKTGSKVCYSKSGLAQPALYLNIDEFTNLSHLRNLDKDQRLTLMFKILKTEPIFFAEINKPLVLLNRDLARLDPIRLIILTIKYWLNKTDVPVWIEFIYSLVISLIFCAHLDRTIDSHYFKFSMAPERIAVENLTTFLNPMNLSKNLQQFDLMIVHFFSQFKICLNIIISLNSLLESPFNVHKFPFYFLNGTFLFRLTMKLKLIRGSDHFYAFLKNMTGLNYFDVIEKIISVLVKDLDFNKVTKKVATNKNNNNDNNNYTHTKIYERC